MLDAILESLKSKKALSLYLAFAVLIASTVLEHFGVSVDLDKLLAFFGLTAAYVVGQGIADSGKSAALINAAKKK